MPANSCPVPENEARRYQALVEKSADGIVILDPAGNFTYASPVAARLLGHSIPELCQRNVFSLVHPEDLERVRVIFAEIWFSQGASRTLALRVLRPDGKSLELEAVGTNLADDPVVGGMVVSFRDITARKETEEHLVRAKQEAEQGNRLTVEATLAHRAPAGCRVLVVEDNLVNQKVVTQMLQIAGCLVDTAGDGKEALCALDRRRYDLVLMDVQMPEMDGLEATRRIRLAETEKNAPRTPIIALTAHARKGDRERFLAEGLDDYLPKPLQPVELARVLERWTTAGGIVGRVAEAEAEAAGHASAEAVIAPEKMRTFDRDDFLLRLGGDEALAEEILGIFREDARQQIEGLLASLSRGDVEAIRQGAHKLRGAAGNVSAQTLQGVAERLEGACQRAGETDWNSYQKQLTQALNTLRESLPTSS